MIGELIDETVRVVKASFSEDSSTHSQEVGSQEGSLQSRDSQDSQQSHDSQDIQQPHDSHQPNQPQISDEYNTMMGGHPQSMPGNVPLDPEQAIKVS